MFNAVFEETLSILKMHFISKNGQNSQDLLWYLFPSYHIETNC